MFQEIIFPENKRQAILELKKIIQMHYTDAELFLFGSKAS